MTYNAVPNEEDTDDLADQHDSHNTLRAAVMGLEIMLGAWGVLVGPFGEEEWEWAYERG